jgi:Na+-transporting NADH:ubiquinone oxidoreductase subunit A
MSVHRVKKGLDLPIDGEPARGIEDHDAPSRVALLAADYPGLRPTMHAKVGDDVRRGQLLMEDKKMPGVRFTSPGSGKIVAVHRGDRRAFQSIVVELSSADRAGRVGAPDQVSFSSFSGSHPNTLNRDEVRELLIESGQWTALRARPFGRVASPETVPHSIFVTAMDSNPLAPSVDDALEGRHGDFERGLAALTKLTDGPVYVCTAEASTVPVPEACQHEVFRGPHPAGTVGYHIHTIDPVSRNKTVWYINYQDVVGVGVLFDKGELYLDRVVSLAGPVVSRPRQIRTRLGASTDDLVDGELASGENRVISGSVLSGRKAMGEALGYLGRYHLQISAIREDREREFLGWLAPGADKFSVKPAFLSKLIPGKKFAFTSSTNGSPRAIVPIGSYEKVMPMDILPTFLLRALVMGDVERAEQLGCLELEEEDVALCSFVCPGKIDYGVHLRNVLTTIEKEG